MATADTFGLVGQIVDSQLRIEEAIGEGGFSLVYKATHLGLSEPVAVKCLKLPSGVDARLVPSFIQRFREESRICYRLSQGNLDIVRSMTSGSTVAPLTGEPVPYMALEWLEGVSLVADLQERRARGLRGRTVEEVVTLFQPAAGAIAYAHAQGVVHRDLKPGNLFLVDAPLGMRMKVLDFGLAKIMNDDAIGMTSNVKTMAPFFFCSPSYGAPEQFDPSLGELGPATDVYAFAMVLIEALCDAKARPASNVAEALAAAMDSRNKPTPRAMGIDLGEEMDRIFSRALALQPKQRWANASELWQAFCRAAADLPPMTARLSTSTGEMRSLAAGAAPKAAPSAPSVSDAMALPISHANAQVYKVPAMALPLSVAEYHVDADVVRGGALRLSEPPRLSHTPPPPDPRLAATSRTPSAEASAGEEPSASSAKVPRSVVVAGVVLAVVTLLGLGGLLAHLFSPSQAPAAPTTTDAAAASSPS